MYRRLLPTTPFILAVVAAALIQGLVEVPHAAAQAASPTITEITPTYSPAAGGANVTITGTNFSTAGGTQFTDEGENPLFGDVTCSSSTQCTATSLAMQVDQQSAFAGEVFAMVGEDMSNAGVQFVWYGQPGITRLTPASARSGTVVTLHGGVFPSAAPYGGPVSIMFGDKAATGVACPNIDECYGQAPAGSGTVQVTITTPGGTSNGLSFTYTAPGVGSPPPSSHPAIPGIPGLPAFPALPALPALPSLPTLPAIPPLPGFPGLPGAPTPPSVSAIAPTFGPATSGTQVTFIGNGFSTTPGATQFAAGQNQFTGVTCSSSNNCVGIAPAMSVPAGSAMIGDGITVTVNGQSSVNSERYFVWYGTPLLNSVQPSSGPAAGGATVTLTGGVFPSSGGLPGMSTVRFGATVATSVSCSADGSTCTVVAPPGSGTVQVTVTTPGGTSNGVPFTYRAGGAGPQPAPVPFPIPLPNLPTLPLPFPGLPF